ncbi:hypothetical protein [Profundibacter sp.]
MKIETLDEILSSDKDLPLSLALLIHRIGDELYTMATTCRNVENALGVVIGTPINPVDQSIISIQGLDRMRQTLEDLVRLSRVVSHEHTLTSVEISANKIKNAVVLSGLVDRLTNSQSARFRGGDDEHDVFWV